MALFSILPVFTLVSLLWLLGNIFYNLYLHPLKEYPGPFWAKITGWYEAGPALSGDHHTWLLAMHKRYGPVVRVAPSRLSYDSVGALRSIYGDRKANIRKSGFTEALALLNANHRNLQTINDKAAYGPRRRLISQAFSEEALRSGEAYILKSIREWCTILGSKASNQGSWSSDVDMKTWANLLTEDILGELCFGASFGHCQKGESRFGSFTEEGSKQAQQLCWLPLSQGFYSILGSIVAYGMQHKWEAMKPQLNYLGTINDMITRRINSQDTSRKDMFHYIIQAKDPETGARITHDEIRVEAGVLFGAGVDTSATCIAACLFYLTQSPQVLARLTSEIRGTFEDVEDIKHGEKLNSLTYLRACIDETLRFTPPAPGPMLRQVTAGGLRVNEQDVPPGVEVSVAAYVIHHNETYFPNSRVFKPERWLPDSLQANRDAFCPFSLGARVCPGRNLAYLDMTLALARLLFLFDVRRAPDAQGHDKLHQPAALGTTRGSDPEYRIKDWFITGRDGPLVQFRARI